MHEVREVPPDPAGVVAACRELHAAIDRLDHAAALAVGVTRNDLRCLNLLEHGPVTPGRIGAALGLTSGGVTALVDRLERQGLVTRARDPEDRRGVRVEATALVFRRLGPVYRRYATELLAMMERYGQEERRAAARHLSDAANACDAALAAVGPGGERE